MSVPDTEEDTEEGRGDRGHTTGRIVRNRTDLLLVFAPTNLFVCPVVVGVLVSFLTSNKTHSLLTRVCACFLSLPSSPCCVEIFPPRRGVVKI